jgi:nicotinamidase-related amidase
MTMLVWAGSLEHYIIGAITAYYMWYSVVDSYSAFFDNNQQRATGLVELLRERALERVVLCGLALDVCVAFSALDCVAAGFETIGKQHVFSTCWCHDRGDAT